MSRSKASSQPSMALSAEQLLQIHQAMRTGSEAEKVAARERFLAGLIGDDFDDEIDGESDTSHAEAPAARQTPAAAEIAHSAAGALQNVTGRYKSAAAGDGEIAQPAAGDEDANRPSDLRRRAIELILMGMNDRCVAATLGVHRGTVTRWRLYTPEFAAELNRRRNEIWGVAADQLRSALLEATGILRKELLSTDGGRRVKAAVAVSRLVGAAQAARPRGPTSAAEIVDDLVRLRRRRDGLLACAGPITADERKLALEELASRAAELGEGDGRCAEMVGEGDGG